MREPFIDWDIFFSKLHEPELDTSVVVFGVVAAVGLVLVRLMGWLS
jgi:hypothetical protein